MKYPFFASFIILCLLLMYEIHKRRNKESEKYQEFWDEEQKANNTRKKSLDDLNYISVPISDLPMDILTEDEQINEYQQILKSLSENTIVNFTGLSNTELKLKYGAPNLELLSSYDQNYTLLSRTLNSYGISLYKHGYINEARIVLEYAISTDTDVIATFDTLAKIYSENKEEDKIKELILKASKINSLKTKSIINNLNSYLS